MDVQVGGGSLSKNKRREKDTHPLLKGCITLDRDLPAGTKIWLAAWKKESTDGQDPWFSINASISGQDTGYGQPPRQPPSYPQSRPPQQTRPVPRSYDDEIPF